MLRSLSKYLRRLFANALSVTLMTSALGVDALVLDPLEDPLPTDPFADLPLDNAIAGAGASEDLKAALSALNAGQTAQAIAGAQRVLNRTPESAPALELLGTALVINGDTQRGLLRLREAVKVSKTQYTAYIKIGNVLVAQGKLEDARVLYEHALEHAPGNRHAHQRLGWLHEQAGEDRLAIQHFEQGLSGTPDAYLGVRVNLARLYNKHARAHDALALLESRVTEDTANLAAHLVLGTSLLRLGNVTRAVSAFEHALKLAPDDERPLLALGIATRNAGDLQRSRRLLEQVVEIKPHWSTGHYQLGETLALDNQDTLAITHLLEASRYSSEPQPLRTRIAELHLRNARVQEAITLLEDIVAQEDAPLDAFALLSGAKNAQGHGEEALRVLQRLVDAQPQNPVAFAELARFHGVRQHYAKAMQILQNGLEVAPEDYTLLKTKSVVHVRLGERENAIAIARKLAAKTDSVNDKFYLAALLGDAEDDDAAIALYREILVTHPQHAPALNNLSLQLSDKGQHEDALSLAKRAVAAEPNNITISDTLGIVYLAAGDASKAEEVLSAAAQSSPQYAPLYLHLGQAQIALSNSAGARSALLQALKISDEFSGADTARALLETLE